MSAFQAWRAAGLQTSPKTLPDFFSGAIQTGRGSWGFDWSNGLWRTVSKNIGRNTPMLYWLGEDDLVHFVIGTVARFLDSV